MDFVKNLKAKLGEHNIFAMDNYDNGQDVDEDYVDSDDQQYYDDLYDNDYDDGNYDNGYDNYNDNYSDGYKDNGSYESTGYTAGEGLGAPEYNSYESTTKKSYSAPKKTASSQSSTVSGSSTKSTGNIYNMNTVKNQNKYKLNSILLRDIYDAKNVASLMIDKDTIVVVNLSLLSDSQKVRAMDFLDGVKYVTKSVFARFTENICTFVPEGVELYGDFFSQIDIESFK